MYQAEDIVGYILHIAKLWGGLVLDAPNSDKIGILFMVKFRELAIPR